MTKTRTEFSIEIMIPAHRRAGLAAEMLMVLCIACAGISAAGLSLVSRILELAR